MTGVMKRNVLLPLAFLLTVSNAIAGIEPGNAMKLTLRGVPAEEQAKIDGLYRVGESGGVRLPLLETPVPAKGMTAEQFARSAEKAYRDAGIYARPAIEVEMQFADPEGQDPKVSVGGHVRRSGPQAFRKTMTLLEAIQAAGDRDEFGGRDIRLIRKGKTTLLDFRKQEVKNLLLEPFDSIIVNQAGVVEGDRG
jgi:protein involved in polysaccharide export with SLBB domain